MLDEHNDPQLTDQDLVSQTLQHSEAYTHIINRYHAALFRYISRLGSLSHEDIEDILQEVFLKVYLNLNDYDPSLKFSSWLYRIAHNETISFFRKKNVRPQSVVTTGDDDSDLLPLIADTFDLKEAVIRQELIDKVHASLTKLEKKYREVLVLKYLEEKTYDEISDILQKPMGTVSTLLNRAKKLLKDELKQVEF